MESRKKIRELRLGIEVEVTLKSFKSGILGGGDLWPEANYIGSTSS